MRDCRPFVRGNNKGINAEGEGAIQKTPVTTVCPNWPLTIKAYTVSACVLSWHLSPVFLPNDTNTLSVRAGSLSQRDTNYVVTNCEAQQSKQSKFIKVRKWNELVYRVGEHNKKSQTVNRRK